MGYPPQGNDAIIVRPAGDILRPGTLATGAAYANVLSYTVTNGRTLQLSRVLISTPKASYIRFRFNGVQFGVERYMSDGAILIEHFPYNYYPMLGNGVMTFEIQARQDTASSTVQGEFSGEEE